MSRRPLRTRLAAAILSPILFLLLLEGGLRLAGYRFDPAEELAGKVQRRELTQREIYRPHPRYLWTLLPNREIHIPAAGMEHVRTNSLGLRGPDLPAGKEPGEFRVLCFGDSVTFGLGLAEEETYPARLQAALQKRIPGARVLNLGVPGWSSLQGRRLLEDVAADLRPDALFFWFGLNDAKENQGTPDSRLRPSGAPEPAGSLGELRTAQLLRSLVVRIRRSALGATRVGPGEFRENLRAFRSLGLPLVAVRYPERNAATVQKLDEVLRQARQAGVTRVVGPDVMLSPFVPLPRGLRLAGRRTVGEEGPVLRFTGPGRVVSATTDLLRHERERLAALLERLRTLSDLLPEGSPGYRELFGEAPAGEVFTDNCHLTSAGARLAGEALAGRLADLVRSPAR